NRMPRPYTFPCMYARDGRRAAPRPGHRPVQPPILLRGARRVGGNLAGRARANAELLQRADPPRGRVPPLYEWELSGIGGAPHERRRILAALPSGSDGDRFGGGSPGRGGGAREGRATARRNFVQGERDVPDDRAQVVNAGLSRIP